VSHLTSIRPFGIVVSEFGIIHMTLVDNRVPLNANGGFPHPGRDTFPIPILLILLASDLFGVSSL